MVIKKGLLCVLVVSALVGVVAAYKPVVLLHGFTGSYHDFDDFIAELERVEPGHPVFALNVDNKWESMKKLQILVDNAARAIDGLIAANPALFKDGFIFLGHSQGGIVSRAVIQQHRYNVTKYISVAGVQSGFYGSCGVWLGKNLTCEMLTDLLYTPMMQNTFSAAGFWRTPLRDKYLRHNLFLPVLNNEEGTAATREYQRMLRDNFLAVGEYHFFGSPDDEIIKPWYSSVFKTLATDGTTVVPRETQYIYTHDTFGLRTAVEQGRAHFYEVPGVKHQGWVGTQLDIVRKYIFPLLD